MKNRKELKEEFNQIKNDDELFDWELENELDIAKSNEELIESHGYEEIGIGFFKKGDQVFDCNCALTIGLIDEKASKIELIPWYNIEKYL